jgi:hypothetical protein
MDDADARREEHRRRVVRKANDENSKVDEVCYTDTTYTACMNIFNALRFVHRQARYTQSICYSAI